MVSIAKIRCTYLIRKDILLSQLELMPSDFTDDIILEGNFVIESLQSFVNTLNCMPKRDTQEVQKVKSTIVEFVSSRFGYKLHDNSTSDNTDNTGEAETGEYAPVIVSLDGEDYAPEGSDESSHKVGQLP